MGIVLLSSFIAIGLLPVLVKLVSDLFVYIDERRDEHRDIHKHA